MELYLKVRLTVSEAVSRRQAAKHFNISRDSVAKTGVVFGAARLSAVLADNGFQPLVISPNYHDDPDAFCGLEDDFLSRLRAGNILYDREGKGEYFQIYSPNYGEDFFLEIVERRGGYGGCGAANAQFRIATKKCLVRIKGMSKF